MPLKHFFVQKKSCHTLVETTFCASAQSRLLGVEDDGVLRPILLLLLLQQKQIENNHVDFFSILNSQEGDIPLYLLKKSFENPSRSSSDLFWETYIFYLNHEGIQTKKREIPLSLFLFWTCLYSKSFSSTSTAASKNSTTGGCLHAGTESMHTCAMTFFRLICSFRHKLFESILCQVPLALSTIFSFLNHKQIIHIL